MKERIAEFVREKAYKPMTFEELATAMGIPERQHVQLKKTLEQMEATGEVVRTRFERYGAPERMNLAVGRLQGHAKGFGFLVSDDPAAEDVFIGRESLNGAWHGDRVVARLSPPARTGGRAEGEIIRILSRATTRVVGTFEAAKNAGYVTPDDRRIPDDIFIPKGATNGAKSGEKVVVQIVHFPEARRNAEGRVVERIGMKGQVGVDIVSVIRKFGLPEAFPPRVLAEAETIPETVQEEAITQEGRRDLRGWTIVTIDGEDAKDLDDAVNVERIGENLWRLGVHIADVSYYVKEGSALDQEAYKRATSVYLADRVVPMLPPKLSNGICSLNPAVDRLTMSCVMEINGEGNVVRYETFPSVIKTTARMTYTKVNQILGEDAEAIAEYRPLVPMFRDMLSLMSVLREKRGRRGALDFDLPEAKVKLNSEGWPLEIRRVNRGVAERVIEEFMLVANETVAEHCHRLAVPFMYRVHGEPAGDRIAGLRQFLSLFGYTLRVPAEGTISPKVLQAITDWTRGRPEENLINSVLLRTMRQAVYSEENLGHFGLAADYYCHFTSPIRRYPDLVVHRVLRALLTNSMNPKLKAKWERWMPEAAKNSSERERVAVEAERETLDIKKAEFMSDKIGETFEGIISGVGQFGFFVQLPTTVEGLVHVSSLADDYYHFHEQFYALIGERTRRRFRLGDTVFVKLNRVDVDSRQIDFSLDEQTIVPVVESAPGETRNRAAKKRVNFGNPMPAPTPNAKAQQEPQGDGRRRKRRKGKGRAEAPVVVELPAPSPVRAAQEAEQKVARRAEVNAAKAEKRQAKEHRRAERQPAPAAPGRTAPRKVERPAEDAAARVNRSSSRVDMWGVPMPSGRPRVRLDDDPGVINPFSISPPPGRERGGRKATAEAPFAPAPGTADETAGLPDVPALGSARRNPGRARRSARPRRKQGAAQMEPME